MPVTVNGKRVQITSINGDSKRLDAAAATSNPLDNIPLDQALTWLENNVTSLATAKVALKQMAKQIIMNRRDLQILQDRVKRLEQKGIPKS